MAGWGGDILLETGEEALDEELWESRPGGDNDRTLKKMKDDLKNTYRISFYRKSETT